MVLAGMKGWLYLLVGVWAYYHVIRQHYGFMVLYKVKNRDLGRLDNTLDRVFLGVMTVLPPFRRFFVLHPKELGIPFSFPRLEPAVWWVAGLTVVLYAGRQWQRWRTGDRIDVPKFLLLGAVIPLHWLTFAYLSWQAAVPTVTIVHNLQYHAIIWFHNRNRYGTESGRTQRARAGGGEPQPAGLCRNRARLQRAVPGAGIPTGAGFRPGFRFLLRLRADALLPGQPHLARAPRPGTAAGAAVGIAGQAKPLPHIGDALP